MKAQEKESSITCQRLTAALLESNHCCTPEEADAIAHVILQDAVSDSFEQSCVDALQAYLPLTPKEASEIVKGIVATNDIGLDDIGSANDDGECDEDKGLDEDDSEWIGEGECELCERFMQLTKHHLIPKSTHARIETKLTHAASALEHGDRDRALLILGPGLQHALEGLEREEETPRRVSIRRIMTRTCNICRPCHSAVHRTHDNMTLALHYNTVDMLLEDTQIYHFCQWAHKQKPGQYAIKR